LGSSHRAILPHADKVALVRGLGDRVVVVCAGGTGDGTWIGPSIGGVTARRLAAEGAKVVVGDLDEAAAQRTASLIADEGGTAVSQQYEAADEESARSLVQRAVAEFGGIDGVHFNAIDTSAADVDGEHDLTTVPLDVWHRRLDVGLLGFVLAARFAIPHLVERGGGAVVATTSDAAYIGEPVRVAYAAAKSGMGAVVRHIASRFGPDGVRANAVSPGLVPSTLMMADPRFQKNLRHPRANRFGRPDDIAAMVTFLLSDDGAWVNGQSISVDGGTVMRP
jgi:NAD(P)-dependent dehydrogenase (short-subunit alcohol dehydrogenase family)